MLIKSLSVEGFRIIGNKIILDFPPNGKIGIFGHNEAGKSSIFEAIEFALFGISRRTKEDLITWGKNKLEVILEFSSGKKNFRIERSLNRKGSHDVKLVQFESGKPLPETLVNTVTSVEQQIEEILGMDGNSYSNLIYIRQKELDSLKNLQKRDREKLINKVMGIEDFDSAVEIVHSDIKENKVEFDSLNQKLEFLKKSHDTYLENLDRIEQLEIEIKENNSKIKNLEDSESKLKSKLDEYELKKSYKQIKNTLKAQESEESSLSLQLKNSQEERIKLQKYRTISKDIEPKFNNLKSIQAKFEHLENELGLQQNSIHYEEKNISSSSREVHNNIKNRGSSLKKGIGFLISGIVVAVLGILFPYLIAVSIILGIIALINLNRYRKLDKNLIEDIKNNERLERKKILDETIVKLKNNILELRKESNFEAGFEVKLELEKLNSTLQVQTGLETIEKLQGAVSNLSLLNDETKIKEMREKISNLETKNASLINELDILEKEKPPNLNLDTDLEEDYDLVKRHQKISDELDACNSKLNSDKGILQQSKKENSNLFNEYEQYPNELENKTKVEDEIRLLEFLKDRFKEISAKMRNQVIPHAANLISEWLPQITDNRYSSLEISEDLKFKVFEEAVGGYKERDLFSGGTQDQFLIALRLAFTKSILDNRTRADEYSLFMDEATSSSDFIRKQGIFNLLDEVKKTFKQIFIIAHEDISNSVDYHLTLQRNESGFTSIKSRSW